MPLHQIEAQHGWAPRLTVLKCESYDRACEQADWLDSSKRASKLATELASKLYHSPVHCQLDTR